MAIKSNSLYLVFPSYIRICRIIKELTGIRINLKYVPSDKEFFQLQASKKLKI